LAVSKVSNVNKNFWREFDAAVRIGRYKAPRPTTDLQRWYDKWANKIVPQLAENTLKVFVLVNALTITRAGHMVPAA
jgi:hypothetical protein